MIRKSRSLPTVLLLVTVMVAAAPLDADDQAAADIGDYLERLEKLGFAGSVVISMGGEPILGAGYGLADRERGIPWTPSTVSTVGSITKQFTGAAILALAEEGLLTVDDPIANYFADVPEDKRGITLYHLLTHSSGIIDLVGVGDWDPIGREEFVRRAIEQELAFAPGEGHEYSNAGFSLLGAVIEQLTGKSWEEYVRERLFLPAGMYETGYILASWGDGQVAQGYRDGEKWGTVVGRPMAEDGPYWVLRANGGVHSTAWDMLRWGEALLDGEPLSPESMATLWSKHVDEGYGDSFYGYGWVVMEQGGVKIITHNGGNGILFADMVIVPALDAVAVVQTNVIADFRMTGQLLEQIGGRIMAGRPLPEVPDWDRSGDADLGIWAGSYTLGGGRLSVTVGEHELRVVPEDPLAFSTLLSLRPVDRARAERLSAKIDEVVTAYLSGDYEPLWEAYGRPMPLEVLAERGQQRLASLAEDNGSLEGHEILGTAFRDGRDVTLVRLVFESGEAFRAYVWNPEEEETLEGSSVRGLDHVVHVLPQVDGTFATWDGRTGTSRTVRLETGQGDGARLIIGGPVPVEAIRTD